MTYAMKPLLCGAMVFLMYLSAIASDWVVLAWDPSPDTRVTGYKIYYGPAKRQYTNAVDVGSVTTAGISNLMRGAPYYFAATAYTSNAVESDFSNEVMHRFGAKRAENLKIQEL